MGNKKMLQIDKRQNIGQLSGQLLPKRWSLINPNRTNTLMNKHKVTETLTPKQATETTSEPPLWNGQ